MRSRFAQHSARLDINIIIGVPAEEPDLRRSIHPMGHLLDPPGPADAMQTAISTSSVQLHNVEIMVPMRVYL